MIDIKKMKHYSLKNEDSDFINNIKIDYDIKIEEFKQVYMIKNDDANNSTSNISNNDQKSKNNQEEEDEEEEEIYDALPDELKKDERNENEIKNNKNPKRGRKNKNEAINNDNNTKRNKYAKDNIARKIKASFFNYFIVNLLNIIIKSVYGKTNLSCKKI